MRRVRHEPVPAEPLAEQRLAGGDGLRGVHAVEARRAPRGLVALDDERRGALVEAVAVRLEDAVRVLDEVEGEGVEGERRAEPDEARRARVEVRAEGGGVAAADGAVDAVGGDHDVGAAEPERVEVAVVAHVGAEAQGDAERRGALLQDAQQRAARDAAEAVAAGGDPTPVDDDVDVVPVGEVGGDRAERRLVGGAEVLERLVGEHDAPPERAVRAVALDDGDVVRRVRLLEQQRGVQPCRSAADDDDPHVPSAWGVVPRDITSLKHVRKVGSRRLRRTDLRPQGRCQPCVGRAGRAGRTGPAPANGGPPLVRADMGSASAPSSKPSAGPVTAAPVRGSPLPDFRRWISAGAARGHDPGRRRRSPLHQLPT